MGYYWQPYEKAIDKFLEWLNADERERKIIKYVPPYCRQCENLGLCRDEKNNWKCRNGCAFIEKESINCNAPIKLNQNKFKLFKKKLPVKRVVIAGCRYYNNYEQAKEYIDFCISNIRKENNIIIVSGGARGADTLGERYAKENGLEIERYLADWDTYGKSAGPKRNEKMAQVSDFVICFWDGKSRGTKSMIEYAKKYEKPVRVKKIEEN